MKGIPFTGQSIPAIRNTKPDVWPAEPIDPSKPFKCVTRRIINPQPTWFGYSENQIKIAERNNIIGHWKAGGITAKRLSEFSRYKVGEKLYIKETYAYLQPRNLVIYKKDCAENFADIVKWKSPRFMPAIAARDFVIVKSARVERLQDIIPADIIKEGCPFRYGGLDPENAPDWHKWYFNLWDTLHPKDPWDTNPFVFRYEVMRTVK